MSLIKRQQCKVINSFININSGLILNKESEIGQIQLLTLCAISAVSRIDLVSNHPIRQMLAANKKLLNRGFLVDVIT
jgi:hypothetical protein